MRAKKKHARPPEITSKNEKCEKLIFRRWVRKKNMHGRHGTGCAKKKHARPPWHRVRAKKNTKCQYIRGVKK